MCRLSFDAPIQRLHPSQPSSVVGMCSFITTGGRLVHSDVLLLYERIIYEHIRYNIQNHDKNVMGGIIILQ